MRERALPGSVEAVCKASRAALAETVNGSKLLGVEGQPIQQTVQATCCKKFFPGTRTHIGQRQTLFAAEPGQAREKLALTARSRLPATQ
ncbi:hypothetical protein D3C87_1275910 [compost metagenome]